MNFQPAGDRVVHLKTAADLLCQAKFIFAVFRIFELGSIAKHIMSGLTRISELCFPTISMFISASPRSTLRDSRKQNSLCLLGPVIKYLLGDGSYAQVICLKTRPFHRLEQYYVSNHMRNHQP